MSRSWSYWLLLALAAGVTPVAHADSGPIGAGELWGDPKDFGNKGLAEARTRRDMAKNDAEKSATEREVGEGYRQGLDQSIEKAGAAFDLAQKALEMYQTLTQQDQRMDPNYQPAGAPDVPSQCMENEACRPCYEKAQTKVNGARKGLEKLRGIFDYTHRVAKQGEEFMQGMGTLAGNGASVAAAIQTQRVDASLADFDSVAVAKRNELTAHVREGLDMLSQCEATYYHNDDWYNRYGFMYYQFILANYDSIH